MAQIVRSFPPNVEVVYSESGGLGKSHYIQEKTKEIKAKYQVFPLGGNVEWNSVMNRLKKINIEDNTLFHIDLCDTSSYEMIRDFLFTLLVTGGVSVKDEISMISKNTLIEVQIPCGFVNFVENFPFLKLFKIHYIERRSLSPLMIPDELKSNIQIVCNYLKHFKNRNLVKYNLYIKGICVDKHNDSCSFHDSIPLKRLPDEECRQLISQNLNIKNATFYQTMTFINVLADQFKKLSNSMYLTVEQLAYTGIEKNQKSDLLDSRISLIESFIELTNYFTKSTYDNLINNQVFTLDSLDRIANPNYDVNKDIQEGLRLLSENKIINFDEHRFALVMINNDGHSISVITNFDREIIEKIEDKTVRGYLNSTLTKLSYLWSSGSGTTQKLIDYRQLNQNQFLENLEHILNVKIDNTIQPKMINISSSDSFIGKSESNLSLNSFIENEITVQDNIMCTPTADDIKDYVFTVDNFIKMILIILRIRSNVPVVMMGETGCGKTKLLKVLARLQGTVPQILNIHAGITDTEILNFMNEKVIPVAIKFSFLKILHKI